MTELATAPVTPAADTPSPAQSAPGAAPESAPATESKAPQVVRQETRRETVERERDEVRKEQQKAYRTAMGRDEKSGKFGKLPDGDQAAAGLNPPEKPAAPKADIKPEPVKGADDAKAVTTAKIEPAKPAIDTPKSWSADKKAVWETLSPEAKEYVSQREQDSHKAISQQGQKVAAATPVFNVLNKYKDVFAANNMTYEQGVDRLLAVQAELDSNPAQAIQKIAKAYKVDLTDLVLDHLQKPPSDPNVSRLEAQIAGLENQLRSVSGDIEDRRQADHKTAQANVLSLIDQFSKDKPDLADLVDEMEVATTSIRQMRRAQGMEPLSHVDLLNQAYEAAVAMNPKVREARRQAETSKAETERIAAARRAADDARSASVLNIRSSPTPSDEVDVRELQRQIYRKHMTA